MRDRSELEALRTRVANQAASLAETVTEGFEGFHMGAAGYVVELAPPEGMSTGGGIQAVQPLRLVPRRKGYPILPCGSVNPVLGTAELRTFEHVAVLHELRFDRPLEITADEYEDFLRKAEVVMNLARIRSSRVGPPRNVVAQRASKRRVSPLLYVVFALVVLLAAFVAYRVLRVMLH